MSRSDKISDRTLAYCAYNEGLREFTGSPWERIGGWSLADVRKKSGQDLVENPGLPQMVFLPSEIAAAELRAEMVAAKEEDVVVTLVFSVVDCDDSYIVFVESVRYSEMENRVSTLKKENGAVFIIVAYSEETHQLFYWDNVANTTTPRYPHYDEQTKRKSNQVSRKDLKKLATEVST